jgi:nitrite reductase/ring-hydroxylating ferredoxin subunit
VVATSAAATSVEALERAFRHAWFPVARLEDLDTPRLATLLGEELVVFRPQGGEPAVLSNRCPHRGAGLALGEVKGDSIACPYHGWEWRGSDGVCTRIPSLGPGERIPANVATKSYAVQVKWNLVFTCLEEPAAPFPPTPEIDGPEWIFANAEPIPAQAGILANTENYRDVAHFPFVHRVSLGATVEEVEPLTVRREGTEVWLDRPFLAAGGVTGEMKALWESEGGVWHRYHVIAPAFVCLVMDYGARGRRVGLNIPSPVSMEECLIYYVEGFTEGFTGTTMEECLASAKLIYEEDLRVLNSIRPREVPLGRELEFSVAADRYTLAYRKAVHAFVAGANGHARNGRSTNGSRTSGQA